jgi:hypothetical protein
VRTARLVYAAIGDVIARRGYEIVRARSCRDAGSSRSVVRALRRDVRPAPAPARTPPTFAGAVAPSRRLACGRRHQRERARGRRGRDRRGNTAARAGRYRLEMRYATVARLPVIGESASTYRSVSLVE